MYMYIYTSPDQEFEKIQQQPSPKESFRFVVTQSTNEYINPRKLRGRSARKVFGS